VREVLERPQLRLVPHVGYVSLFPFIGRLIPPVSYTDNLILKMMLELLFGASVFSYSGARKYKAIASFFFVCVVGGFVGFVHLVSLISQVYCLTQGSWILEKQLDLISNQSILWTDYGLRSLAKTRCIICSC
jgi:hypothetical protein